MSIQELYARVGGDYDEVIRRLGNDQRVGRLLKMLLRDESMPGLKAAMETGDTPTAFRMAHTLKGVYLNMALSTLAAQASALTEDLRHADSCEAGRSNFETLCASYEAFLAAMQQLI